jgi:hypothetical protein
VPSTGAERGDLAWERNEESEGTWVVESMTAIRFSGESPWDAIVNHFSLDIAEESGFEVYCIRLYYDDPRNLPLEALESLYRDWNRFIGSKF